MGKQIIIPIDNFAQAGEQTLQEIAAAAAAQSGNAAEVVRDPSTGKVIQVKVNLPDTAPQTAIDAITNNKGVATALVLQFPQVTLDENFDAVAVGALPANDAAWAWSGDTGVGVASDQSVSAPNSMKIPTPVTITDFQITAVGEFSAFLASGRTIESEVKIRFSDTTLMFFAFGQTVFNMTIENGDLKMFSSGALVVSGLAINTFHTIKSVWVAGSATVTLTVNGVPLGDFTIAAVLGLSYARVRFSIRNPNTVHIDDLKIITVG